MGSPKVQLIPCPDSLHKLCASLCDSTVTVVKNLWIKAIASVGERGGQGGQGGQGKRLKKATLQWLLNFVCAHACVWCTLQN